MYSLYPVSHASPSLHSLRLLFSSINANFPCKLFVHLCILRCCNIKFDDRLDFVGIFWGVIILTNKMNWLMCKCLIGDYFRSNEDGLHLSYLGMCCHLSRHIGNYAIFTVRFGCVSLVLVDSLVSLSAKCALFFYVGLY